MKHITLILSLLLSLPLGAKEYSVKSPSGKLEIGISTGKTTTWHMKVNDETVTASNRIALTLSDGTVLGDNSSVLSAKRTIITEDIKAPFYRKPAYTAICNALVVKMKGGYSIELRAYNEGVAYRMITNRKEPLTVVDESFQYNSSDRIIMADKKNHDYVYESSFEFQYTVYDTPTNSPEGTHSYLPIVVDLKKNGKLLLMQTDMLEYPGPFIRMDPAGLKAYFPKMTKDFSYSKRFNKRRFEFEDCIAKIPGQFALPWRIAAYASEDKYLPVNTMSYTLASPCRLEDISWIKPGLSTWDWWNGFTLTGVDFKCGINTPTYKYHIDFAAAHNIPYIVIDEGWYPFPGKKSSAEANALSEAERMALVDPIVDIDIPELCRYGAQKGVKVVLWSTLHLVDFIGMDAMFDRFAKMGVAGFKLDFLDGQDQESVKLMTSVAEAAARHRLILDFHGVYAPAGLNRCYPNVLNFEGVWGLEMTGNKFSQMPDNDVFFPFIRNVAGPVDYTPGSMDCMARNEKQLCKRGGFVQGTRAHQVALYAVLDSPFTMMCDSPSKYEREEATTRFITSIPTTFDEVTVLDGEIGKMIVTAKRKGDKWYVGGLTGWSERDYTLDFSFLPEGKYKVTLYRDGANADRLGNDNVIEQFETSSSAKRTVHMAPGGGFACIINKI